ncbi:hypothetical protein GCM10023149_01840 [Mucilaginibacter gynuensis]|uniref:DUF1330 domain-containing protein n=1 Tax=Mucilaginibacter gynuensis TaxID=1302236 RepID=A0ABP8FP26_9SPHI
MISFPDIEEGKGPVLMLNMLKFRDRQLYFEEYIPAFNKVVSQLGIEGVKVALVTEVLGNIIATEGEVWDAIVMVEYPNAETFKTIAMSAAYHDIAEPLRVAALDELKLFMTRKTDF